MLLAVYIIAMVVFGISQVYAAFLGVEYYSNWIWAIAAFAGCFVFRFTLPLTIFAFLGAKNLWGWEWYWAALFVAPGLALMIPAILAQLVAATLSLTSRK